jgi:hypothetical protein
MESIISLALDPVRQQFAAGGWKLALAIEIAMPPLSTERAHDRAFRASSKSTQEAVNMWLNDRILALFDIHLPIIQAPMAGSVSSDMVVAVSAAGRLGFAPMF